RGIQIANTCKIMYQKRPRLIPILDEYARLALDIPWYQTGTECFQRGLAQVRQFAGYAENITVLQRLSRWLSDQTEMTKGLSLSMVRLIDILAWGATWGEAELRS